MQDPFSKDNPFAQDVQVFELLQVKQEVGQF